MLDLLYKRRSTRKFKKKEIEKEKINILIKGALLSPSSRGLKPWEFIIVNDKKLLSKLSISKEHSALFLKNAPIGIVIIADPDKCDVWIEDCSIASIIIQLTAQSIGLSSCWIQIRERKYDNNISSENYIKKTLNIPEKYKVESIIAIGYPDENLEPHTDNELHIDKIFYNYYYNKLIFI